MKNLKTLLTAIAGIVAFSASAESIPRPEYPRPQFERSEWINLHGTWTYLFDFGQSGVENGLQDSKGFADNITVPFCPESDLSGVGRKDFIPAIWYHRTISIPQSWDGKHIILHFGGVDYRSQIFIDGKKAFEHFGGAASFAVDITNFVKAGASHNLVVYAQDDVRSRL